MRCNRETWVREVGPVDYALAFYDRRYQVTIRYDRSAARSAVVVIIRPTCPNGPYARRRPLAAFAHRICAEFEERSYQLQALWTVSVSETVAHVSAELGDGDDPDLASEIAESVLAEVF